MRDALRSVGLQVVAKAIKGERTAPQVPSRILLVRPDHLGDVLFLTPALRALRHALPDSTITVLVGPWAKAVLENNSDIDHVEVLPFPWFDRSPRKGWLDPYRRLLDAACAWREGFDVAVICRFDHWWGAWFAAAAGIPRIIGYDVPGVAPFLTERVPYLPDRHEVLQNIRLLGSLGVESDVTPDDHPLHYQIEDGAREQAICLLQRSGLKLSDGAPLVTIHPGSGAPVKRWLPSKWAEVMDRLHKECGAVFVVTGGQGERELADQVVALTAPETPAVSVAGKSSFAELAALFERSELVLGPDSGPLHLAVAVGAKTVHLYGPVSPAAFGPWGSRERNIVVTGALACQFCNRLDWLEEKIPEHPCVTRIPAGWVWSATSALLKEGRAVADGVPGGFETTILDPGGQ